MGLAFLPPRPATLTIPAEDRHMVADLLLTGALDLEAEALLRRKKSAIRERMLERAERLRGLWQDVRPP
jgi:hypothetical protein